MAVAVSIDFMNEVTKSLKALTDNVAALTKGQERLELNVATLLSGRVAPEAELQAKLLTVSITVEGITDEPCGHGLLIQTGGGDNNPVYYLLTAAHVLATLDQGNHIKIRWAASNVQVFAAIQCIFLDKRYIASGTHDIGLARLEIQEMMHSNLRLETVTTAQNIEHGRVVTGLARVFLCGTMVHKEVSCHRVFIAAVSAPGCSGCPLFDSEKKLVALVHGSSKHRHLNSIDDASSSVYGDACIFDELDFQKVNSNWIEWVKEAENWSEEDARKCSECLTSDDCPERTREFWGKYSCREGLKLRLSDDQISWNTIMRDLSDEALDDERVLLEHKIQCLTPQISVHVDGETTHQPGVVTPNKA